MEGGAAAPPMTIMRRLLKRRALSVTWPNSPSHTWHVAGAQGADSQHIDTRVCSNHRHTHTLAVACCSGPRSRVMDPLHAAARAVGTPALMVTRCVSMKPYTEAPSRCGPAQALYFGFSVLNSLSCFFEHVS
jgi:hypothetical protein